MESNGLLIFGSRWNATVAAGPAHCLADQLTIVSFVTNDSDTAHASNKFGTDLCVTDLTGSEYGFHQSAFAIDHRVELAVGPAPGMANGLRFFAPGSAVGILVNLEVARINETQDTLLVT